MFSNAVWFLLTDDQKPTGSLTPTKAKKLIAKEGAHSDTWVLMTVMLSRNVE